jgi:tetratricopeptide (TPR) repeat protein
MDRSRKRPTCSFLISIGLVCMSYGCQGIAGNPEKASFSTDSKQKRPSMTQATQKQGQSKPRLVVLPLQPQQGQAFNGAGLGIHFLLGNIVALHTGLSEFWFGWRVEKIFLEDEKLSAYCRGEYAGLDIAKLGKDQDIRYWLQGTVRQQKNLILVTLILTDTLGEHDSLTTELTLKPANKITDFQKKFISWLKTCGLPFPDAQVDKAIWPETTTPEGLDLLGRALEAHYLHASWGDKGPIDLELFDRAVSAAPNSYLAHDLKGWILYKNKDYQAAEESFRHALKLNPNGLGAMAGLMWCAIYTNNEDEAYTWATAKADLRGESREAAKAAVRRRMRKAASETKD